jgi:hypothetical protein
VHAAATSSAPYKPTKASSPLPYGVQGSTAYAAFSDHPRLASCFQLGRVSCHPGNKASSMGPTKKKTGAKKIREFRKHHHFDEKRRYWVRNVDQVALIDESVNDRRFYLTFLGWLLFILWEGYWLLEIREQFVSIGRLQLPYMFLFLILFVVPLAWYLFLRRKLRRLAIIPMDAVRH